MKIKKILSLSIVGLIGMLSLGLNAKAEGNTVTLSCNKTSIAIGESTTCTVSGTTTFTDSTNAPSASTVTIAASQYLTISNVTANTTSGWSKTNEASGTTGIVYSFSNSSASSKITSGTKFDIMSFTATLSTEAKNLTDTSDCAQICISAATFNGGAVTASNLNGGTCYNPAVTVADCTGSSCNAQTGAFLNYAIIGVCALVALTAILVARKNNKFYKI